MVTLTKLQNLLVERSEEHDVRSASYELVRNGEDKNTVIEVISAFCTSNNLCSAYADSLTNVMSDIEKHC